MITLTAALLIGIGQQIAPEAATPRDKPDRWELAYPFAVAPYVEDYYNCLKSRNHVIGNGVGFADQHRGDIPKCVEQRAEALEKARATLERRGEIEGFTADSMNGVFDTIQQIHIARGQDLDRNLSLRLGQPPTYYNGAVYDAAPDPGADAETSVGGEGAS